LDLLLVFPNNRRRAYGRLADTVAAISPPVQLGLTAAFARRAGCAVAVIDADAEDLSPEETARRIGDAGAVLTVLSTDSLNSGDVTKMSAASDTLRALRGLGAPARVLLEGVVPSAYPERMLREEGADFVCQGEAFQPVVDLVCSLKARRRPVEISGIWFRDGDEIVTGGRAPLVQHPDELPMIAWDLLPMDRYRAHHWHCFDALDRRQPYASIYTNLGCPYACTFCNVNVVVGKPNFRPRSPEAVLEEIDLLVRRYGVRNIRIVDNVFTIRPDLCEKLCELIARRGYDLNLWAYARVETIRNEELLRKMRAAGLRWIAYGIEAASERVRDAVDKPSSAQVIDRAIEATRRAGIHMVGNFIFGLPEDTRESMAETYEMATRYLFEYANFYAAMAYPGTELHEQARRDGIRLPDSWAGYGQYSEEALPMSTRHAGADDVLRFRDEAFVRYNTHGPYVELVRRKFGEPAVAFINEILKIRLRRRLLETA
jgi:radical SAM superfamily enzyme YgiQ (UPF0313 family)